MTNNEDESNDTLPSLGNTTSSSSSSSISQHATARRKAAYAGRSGRELSTSAVKRQSIMALGSIRHLQHMYAKNGLAAPTAPQIGSSGRVLPLAIPRHQSARGGENGGDADDGSKFLDSPEEDLPPSPSPPAPSVEKSFQVEIPSIRVQKQEVYRRVAEVCERWGLVEMGKSLSSRRESSMGMALSGTGELDTRSSMTPSPIPFEDQSDDLILTLLNTTTSAIRSVQRYFLSLPPEKLPYTGQSSSSDHDSGTLHLSTSRGLPTLGVVTASRPIPRHSMVGIASSSKRSLSPPSGTRGSSHSSLAIDHRDDDPTVRLRKASLATLGALKEMEVRYRLPRQEEGEGDATGLLSDSLQDISISSASGNVPPLTFNVEDTSASEQSGSSDHTKGHIYRDDVSIRELAKEAQTVREWIETVDMLMSAPTVEASTPRLRTKSGNMAPREEAIPLWANRESKEAIDRLRLCLRAHLPQELLAHVPSSGSKEDLMLTLSDGQILCTAYNALLRRSQRPWGFIPAHSIHDVIGLTRQREEAEQANVAAQASATSDSLRPESVSMRRMSSDGLSNDGAGSKEGAQGAQRIGLTFRRLENLRLFVAALKLRYLLTAPVDLKIVARKEAGWQDILEQLACSWVEAAADEKLAEEPELE